MSNLIHPQVINLLNRPQMVQRTEEWFLARKTRITASEVGSILGVNPYKSKNKYWIEKKCQLMNIPLERKGTFTTEHGVKYEPVIQQIIREQHKDIFVDEYGKPKDPLFEFGLIPHPSIPFLGASPDGILYNGRMVEIKCVVSREITKSEVVPYYYSQVQTQLECCGLDECEFTECKILEYKSFNDFCLDTNPDNNNIWYNVFDKKKGIVLQNNRNEYIYIDPMTIDNNILPNTKNGLKDFLNDIYHIHDKNLIKSVNYWYCDNFSMKLISRNQNYIDKMIDTCGKFWETLSKEIMIEDGNLISEEDMKKYVPYLFSKSYYFENFTIDNLVVKNTKKRSLDFNDTTTTQTDNVNSSKFIFKL